MSYYATDQRDTRPAPGKLQCPACRHWYFDCDFDGNLCQSCYEQQQETQKENDDNAS